jgi:fructose-1,6-bisphosphatase I
MDSPDRASLTHHLLRARAAHAGRGEFSALLSQVVHACKAIGAECRRAGLGDAHGKSGVTGHHGDEVERLDAFANDAFVRAFDGTGLAAALVSEEMERPHLPAGDGTAGADYIVCFDPVDGSSNIAVAVTVGTIFSVQRRRDRSRAPSMEDLLRPGRGLLAAGYVLYGPATVLVLATDDGVDLFTQDPATGEFLLTRRDLRIPPRGPHYSLNEANERKWTKEVRALAGALRAGKVGEMRSARYVGSLVADFHRTLLKGGLFAYPGEAKKPEGKIRLLYEAAPLAWICERAGGRASDGARPILDLAPTAVHQRTPVLLGGADDLADAERILAGS